MILAAQRSIGWIPAVIAIAVLFVIYTRNLRKEHRAEREVFAREYEAALADAQAKNVEFRRRRAEAELEEQVEAVFYDQSEDA